MGWQNIQKGLQNIKPLKLAHKLTNMWRAVIDICKSQDQTDYKRRQCALK